MMMLGGAASVPSHELVLRPAAPLVPPLAGEVIGIRGVLGVRGVLGLVTSGTRAGVWQEDVLVPESLWKKTQGVVPCQGRVGEQEVLDPGCLGALKIGLRLVLGGAQLFGRSVAVSSMEPSNNRVLEVAGGPQGGNDPFRLANGIERMGST